jgi:hypothetical protein
MSHCPQTGSAGRSGPNQQSGCVLLLRTHEELEGVMHRQGRLSDRSASRTYSDRGRAGDWTAALVVALVLSIAVVLGAVAIAIFENTALLVSRDRTTASEPPPTGRDGGQPETSGTAR